MIELKRKQNCSGCTACQCICPTQCITMGTDEEGFMYPVTDIRLCVNCGSCNRVCPVLRLQNSTIPISYGVNTKAYAARIDDRQIRLSSSSGGLFTALATHTINSGGMVYGAAWNNDEVRHIGIDKIENLSVLRGSKYVQSSMGTAFIEIRDILREGRRVLFTGTPCQIAGLKAFLRKEYSLLLTVEVACHGAPSPAALRSYKQYLKKEYGVTVKLDFRSKPDGDWRDYKVTAYHTDQHYFYENQKRNIYMKGFLHELYSRPICSECPFKAGISHADITLGDFWGVENVAPDFPSRSGVSLVLTHTPVGHKAFSCLSGVLSLQVPVEQAVRYNRALLHSEPPHPERTYFFRHLQFDNFKSLVNECLRIRPYTRLKLKLKAYSRKLGF